MPNIGITGAGGQMGGFYLRHIIENLRFPVENVIVRDIHEGRLAAVLAKYPGVRVAHSTEELARTADTFFVTTNTPSHPKEIRTLARGGARRILTEKGVASILTEKTIPQTVGAPAKR